MKGLISHTRTSSHANSSRACFLQSATNLLPAGTGVRVTVLLNQLLEGIVASADTLIAASIDMNQVRLGCVCSEDMYFVIFCCSCSMYCGCLYYCVFIPSGVCRWLLCGGGWYTSTVSLLCCLCSLHTCRTGLYDTTAPTVIHVYLDQLFPVSSTSYQHWLL